HAATGDSPEKTDPGSNRDGQACGRPQDPCRSVRGRHASDSVSSKGVRTGPPQLQGSAVVPRRYPRAVLDLAGIVFLTELIAQVRPDRKSTRLNSSHVSISYAVFCLKKKTIYNV